jgi:hypothetical protein
VPTEARCAGRTCGRKFEPRSGCVRVAVRLLEILLPPRSTFARSRSACAYKFAPPAAQHRVVAAVCCRGAARGRDCGRKFEPRSGCVRVAVRLLEILSFSQLDYFMRDYFYP